MIPIFRRGLVICTLPALFIAIVPFAQSAPVLLNTNLQIRLVMNTTNGGPNPVRIAKDPRNNQLYYLKINGDIFRVNLQAGSGSTSTKVYSAADHGLSSGVEGLAIGPDGTIYVLGNTLTNSSMTFARISKGVPNVSGVRVWSTLVRTEPYPRSQTAFDHLYNGIIVSPDGQYLFVNAGSRTDHGEVQSTGGLYPNLRDVPLTAGPFGLAEYTEHLVQFLTTMGAGSHVIHRTENPPSLPVRPVAHAPAC